MTTLQILASQTPRPTHPQEWLVHAIPDWLPKLSSPQRTALIHAAGPVPSGLTQAGAADKAQLKSALQARWTSRQKLEQVLGRLQSIEAFAEPLLVAALQQRCNITLDVRQTYLRLYVPEGIFVAYRTRTISLLDAALQNFEAKEARPGFFDDASCFISRPSATGQFDILPMGETLALPVFVALCRELDIGGRYQAYLKNNLLDEPVASAVVQACLQNNDRDAFRAAAAVARIRGDISPQCYRTLQALSVGQRTASYRGKPQYGHDLYLLDTLLIGIVIFAPDLEQSRQAEPVVVYIPDDPEHPLRQYGSTTAFFTALAVRLRSASYQQFFNRFIPLANRGRFFAALNAQLFKARREPVENPALRMTSRQVKGDLWVHGYERRLAQIIQDARLLAVPTGDEDLKSRWARWDSFMQVAETVLELAAFTAASFVPVLGEGLLVYTVYQLLDETFEGIVDWSQGRRAEAAAHLLGVAENMALMGVFVAGGKVVGAVRSTRPSSFVAQMKVVQGRDGQARLWHPDLAPYAQSLDLDTQAQPQANGLYLHQAREVLLLDGRQYVVERDPSGTYRIQHPVRADAYAPRLAHNEVGAWGHEAERPLAWQGTKLMRRLGHSVDSFSDETLEQIRIVSGVEEASLRQLHVEHARPPVLLAETIKRFRAARGIEEANGPVIDDAVGADVQVLQEAFPQLPRALVDELLIDVTEVELQQMSERHHLPLRVRQAARTAMGEWRIALAYEGLYLPTKGNPDTWRLALHSLAQWPEWPAQARIEIREGAPDGPLLDSIGPSSSTVRKVLAPVEETTPRVFGEQGNSVHSAEDFYTQVLNALTEAERRTLGYNLGDGGLLRQAVQRAPLERAMFRKNLLDGTGGVVESSISARLLGKQRGYARLDERLLGTGDALGLEARFRDLFPAATTEIFSDLRQSFSTDAHVMDFLSRQETEWNALNQVLDGWVCSPSGERSVHNQEYHRGDIAKTIKQSWQGKYAPSSEPGQAQGEQTLDLSFKTVEQFLETLPPLNARFEHVAVVRLKYAKVRGDLSAFFEHFPNVREVYLDHNELTDLTPALPHLRGLRLLSCSANQLRLTSKGVEELSTLALLEVCRLDNNPRLGAVPDIGRMPALRVLDLQNTGVREWPSGLFELPRPRDFELSLLGNPIEQLPQVVEGGPQARLIARTWLDREALADNVHVQLDAYIRSVGYDPARTRPPTGEEGRRYWLEGNLPEPNEVLRQRWDDLEAEAGSQGFFDLLAQLTESADYSDLSRRFGLTSRVWRMLAAMGENTELRQELFRVAMHPDSCADAGSQIFNEMGIKVLIHEAYRSASVQEIEAKLVALAQGKSRLDQLNEIARAAIQQRLAAGEHFQALDDEGDITGTIDEVETYLAYQTGLAKQLALPWQSEGMLFGELSGVDEHMLEDAYRTVLELEMGDGRVNQIIGQDFWQVYLRHRYPIDIEENERIFAAKADALLESWEGRALTGDEYARQITLLGDDRKTLHRRLTEEILNRTEA
ncbi:NEL-type E3 ubiquitin ligase domain-containing protein [Pseudomonas agronomica]|uniref:NEL-type E3 ubiquitin ligase domain-containing protein n=1 Tax=Pseudomonas agronomica TaxID=2979328 RepID=UPI002FCDC81D